MATAVNQKEIERKINNVIKVVARSVDEGLEEVGQRGVTIVKINSPYITGRLRNSMGYLIKGEIKGSSGSPSDIMKSKNIKNAVVIGTNVVYAGRVEYLSKTGSAGYMQRSYNQLKPIAEKVMQTAIKGGIGT